MLSFSIVSVLKSQKFSGKIRIAFESIAPYPCRFWQSIISSKQYVQHCCSRIFLKHSIPHNVLWWNICYLHTLFSKKLFPLMMSYKNIKAINGSPDEDTDFFEIVAGILLGYSFIAITSKHETCYIYIYIYIYIIITSRKVQNSVSLIER